MLTFTVFLATHMYVHKWNDRCLRLQNTPLQIITTLLLVIIYHLIKGRRLSWPSR